MLNWEEKITKIKTLINQREEIDTELRELMGEPTMVKKSIKVKRSYIIKSNGKKWARKYDKCVYCGKTDKKHKTNGFCIGCYSPKKLAEYRRKIGEAGPISSAGNKYGCEDCGERFVSVLGLMDVSCPKCKGIHISKLNK